MAFLTMAFLRQPVATVSPQIKPFSRYQRAERLPPVAPPLFHNCSIPRGPKTRALAGNNRRWRSTTPSVTERGSSRLAFGEPDPLSAVLEP